MTNEVTTCQASNCDRPADDGYLCTTSLTELEQTLAETHWLADELNTALTKQTRFASSGGKVTTSGATQPLILNPDASDAIRELTLVLLTWQAHLADSLGMPVRHPDPKRSSAFLLTHLHRIRLLVTAGDLYDEIRTTTHRATKLIDRPNERRYLGDCGPGEANTYCAEPLWGTDGQQLAECKVCGTQFLQEARIKAIREQASTGLNDRIMTATEAASVLVAYDLTNGADESKIRDRIIKWAAQPADPTKHPQLIKRTDLRLVDARPRPGYKFGDILDILNRQQSRKKKVR